MRKKAKFFFALFSALGLMLYLTPRDNLPREVTTSTNNTHGGLEKYFESAWNWIGKAVEQNGAKK